jgi:phenylacetate-coenzyme A ligase PaaK-like adenylate-forming protein/glycosyltransferase involved in cell wall biosynthesis
MSDVYVLSVVAPCLNEEVNIGPLTERLLAATADAEIPTELILIDDGSSDGTWAAIAEQRERYGDAVVGVRHRENEGIPASWRTGVYAARGNYVCFIDGDLQNPPEEVVTLYRRLLESQFDIVQGYRSSIGRLRDSRLLFSKALNLLLNLGFGMRARDNKSGFVLSRRRVMEDILTYRRRYRYFQTFITVSAKAKGYSILEVETLFQSRHAGSSFIDRKVWRVAFDALHDFLPALIEFRVHAKPRHGASVAPAPPAPLGAHPYRGWRRVLFETYFATMPLHKWLIRRRTRELYLDLKQTEWMSQEQMQELQLGKLQRLVQHAYVHVPHYRHAMNAVGVRPEDIRELDDIRRLPLLSKHDVRRRLHFDLFADDHRKRDMHKISTSGSTGEPFTTYADRHQLEMRFATTLRAMEWTGWRFGDRQVRLWHQTIGMTRTQILRERIDAWLLRRLFIPAFEIRPENLESFVEAIRRHRPVLVDGYAESLNFLATYVREGGEAGFSPRAVISSAQALPDNVRSVIEQGFATKVYDKYGSREFSGIAYQCGESSDHHVMDESYIVELLVEGRPARPGEIGELVITDLNNFSVPLIRYRIGDLATAVDASRPCRCGRGLSRIGRIEGRTQAIVHCGNGTWLPGTFFAHFFKDHDYAIRSFQIYQDRKGAFALRVVKNRQFSDESFTALLDELRQYVGDETEVTVEFVDEIPLLRTGKRSPVVSEIKEDFQALLRGGERQARPRLSQ